MQLTRADESERGAALIQLPNMETEMANVTSQSSEAIARAMQALIETSNESGTKFVMGWGQDRNSRPDRNEVHGCGCGCARK
jgi:hypothetical protein